MIIDQLPSANPNMTDETVTEQGTNLFKTTWQKIRDLFLSTAAAFSSDVSAGGDISSGRNITAAGDVTVGGVFDVTQRRCSAALSSAGWYRVVTFDIRHTGSVIEFYIGRPALSGTPAENHKISFFMNGGGLSSFVDETSRTSTVTIDKIRLNYVGYTGYIDIHNTSSSANDVFVYFNVYGKLQQAGTTVSMGLVSVADSPSGENQSLLYSFAANTNVELTAFTPTFSGTANPSVNNTACSYSIKDGVMYAGGRFNIASFISGSTTVYFTLPVSLGIADRGAETIGTVFTATKTLQLRSYGAEVYITDAGGNYSGGLLNTGYWSFQIVAPIYN